MNFLKRQFPFLFIVIVLIMAFRSSVMESFRTPTRSMLPTLMTGDFLFANKFKYGFHLPFTEYFHDKPVYLSEGRKPKRGEVVIFNPPEAGQESLYIKRIIAIPGDKIRFAGKHIILNGVPLNRVEVLGADRDAVLDQKGFDPDERYSKDKLHLYRESVGEKSYLTIEDDTFENSKAEPEVIVSPDHYFVLGDNRDDTRDSRMFGVISLHSIRGKAFVIWLSYRISFTDSKWSFRPERIGHLIQ